MLKIKHLLFFAALILLIGAAHGQIAYTGAVSAQRLNHTYSIDTNFQPKVMSVPDNPNYVITLTHEENPSGDPVNSLLFLTQESTNSIKVVRIQNFLITDFDIFQTFIVYCGIPSNSLYENSIGIEDYMNLFSSTSSINSIDIQTYSLGSGNLKKIRMYQNDGIMKFVALTENNYLLDIDYTNLRSDLLRIPLIPNDIIVTEDFVGVLGTISDSACFVFAHEKTNLQNYTGAVFRTHEKYENTSYLFEEMPGIGYYENFTNGNQAFIGYVRSDLKDEFAVIDLQILNVFGDFIVDSGLLRHSITDLCHDNVNQTIYCLSHDFVLGDYIYQPFPPNNSLTAIFPITNTPSDYYLTSVTPYYNENNNAFLNNYFIAAGRKNSSTGILYWLDDLIWNYSSPCLLVSLLNEDITSDFYLINSLTYPSLSWNISVTPSVINSVLLNDIYIFECNY